MIDRVTGRWPTDGAAGLGRWRAVKDVDPDEWYFKAHFYRDPVQPGSLGIEMMLQLLQFAMLDLGLGKRWGRRRASSRWRCMTRSRGDTAVRSCRRTSRSPRRWRSPASSARR